MKLDENPNKIFKGSWKHTYIYIHKGEAYTHTFTHI